MDRPPRLRLSLLLPAIGVLAGSAAALAAPFTPSAPILRTDAGTIAVAAGDFDGDGRLDVVTANPPGQSLSVFTHEGARSFAPALRLSSATSPVDVAVADLDLDGALDLVAAGTAMSVFRGDGLGGFAAPTSVPVSRGGVAVAAGDLNGDAIPDLVVAAADSSVTTFLGLGGATFGAAQRAALPSKPTDLAIGDLDGDGRLDVVVSHATGLAALHGQGDGTFGAVTPLALGFFRSVALGLLDAGGVPDVAATTTNQIQIFTGDGDGTFTPHVAYTTTGVYAHTLGDLNADGRPDLAATGYASGADYVSLRLGNGDATFATETRRPAGLFARGIATGDVDADGRPDVLVAASGVAWVLYGTGLGGIEWYPDAAVNGVVDVATGDVNGDGRPDVVGATYAGQGAWVALGNGDGTLTSTSWPALGHGAMSVALADFDEDGHLDLAATNESGSSVTVVKGQGTGTFFPKTTWSAGSLPRDLVSGDFDGDGHADLAVPNPSAVSVLLGDGAGRFAAPVGTATSTGAWRLAAGDLDGDGRDDLVVGCGSRVDVRLGAPGGALVTRPTVIDLGTTLQGVALADPDADGKLDLVVVYDATLVFRGRGDGTFDPYVAYYGVPDLAAAAAGDWNGDGFEDLALCGWGSVGTLMGNGTGSLARLREVAVPDQARALATADMNGDGSDDLVVASWTSDRVSVLLGSPPVVSAPGAPLPRALHLERARPNPTSGSCEIDFAIPEARRVSLQVFDVNGRRVAALLDRVLPAGDHRIAWDGRGAGGARAPRGLYFVRLRAGSESATTRVVRF